MSIIPLLTAAVLTCAVTPGHAAPKPKPAAASKRKPPAVFRPSPSRQTLSKSWEIAEREYLGTPATERAVERALAFLAAAQNADGTWTSSSYSSEVAIVGLCALAFLAAGHQPNRGKYGQVLARATDYLASSVQRNGLIHNTSGTYGPPMYGHGFATLALAELYGQSRRRDLRDKLEAAVKLILNSQNAEGGWRYYPRVADADISVSICQVMALRAAHNAGVPVPRETIDRALDYARRCANNYDGGFSYMPSQRSSGPARTGAGVLSLIILGRPDSDEVRRGLDYLMAHPPGTTREQHLFYGVYYNTQAMYQAGGKYWQFWFPRMAEFLLATQRSDGSWSDGPGLPYATAMGVLALQVPSNLLPIYQK